MKEIMTPNSQVAQTSTDGNTQGYTSKREAVIWLEENNISGDTMVNLDHNVTEETSGAIYLHDLLVHFHESMSETQVGQQRYEHKIVGTRERENLAEKEIQELEKEGWEVCGCRSYYYVVIKRPITPK